MQHRAEKASKIKWPRLHHNPCVGGSNPSSATKDQALSYTGFDFGSH